MGGALQHDGRCVIAGRCECGQIMQWVERRPDEHLRCFGLRWCGKCGEPAGVGERCKPCRRARHTEYMRIRLRNPFHRAKHREEARRWEADQRRRGTAHYERQKAQKRLRYRLDPAYAEACRVAAKRRHDQRVNGAHQAA